MNARTLLLVASILLAVGSTGCFGPKLTILSQAYMGLPPEVPGHIALVAIDFRDVDVAENSEYKEILQASFAEPLRRRLGLLVAPSGTPLPGLFVVRPRVTSIKTDSTREMVRMRVDILAPDGRLFDSIALRDIPSRCFGCPIPGEEKGPTPRERAKAEGEGLGHLLASYLSRRMHGWTARGG